MPEMYKQPKNCVQKILKNWLLIFEIALLCIFPQPNFEIYITQHYEVINNASGICDITIGDKVISKPQCRIPVKFFLGDIFTCIMFARVWFLVRSYYNYSLYKNAYSMKICKEKGVHSSTRFVMKC